MKILDAILPVGGSTRDHDVRVELWNDGEFTLRAVRNGRQRVLRGLTARNVREAVQSAIEACSPRRR